MKANCHPKRRALFSNQVAKPWERGLCSQCHAAARKSVGIVRKRVAERMRKAPPTAERGTRTSALHELDETIYLQRVLARARKLGGTPNVFVDVWCEIIESTGGQCVYCSKRSMRLSPNYVVPLRRGGKDRRENVVPACPRCAHCKGSRLVVDWPAAKEIMLPSVYSALVARTYAAKV